MAGTPHSISDNDLEETTICKEHQINILPMNIEATKDPNQCKRVIKFANRKLPECLLQIKKMISSMSYNHLNITGRVFVNTIEPVLETNSIKRPLSIMTTHKSTQVICG